eukprot:Opistho-2@96542
MRCCSPSTHPRWPGRPPFPAGFHRAPWAIPTCTVRSSMRRCSTSTFRCKPGTQTDRRAISISNTHENNFFPPRSPGQYRVGAGRLRRRPDRAHPARGRVDQVGSPHRRRHRPGLRLAPVPVLGARPGRHCRGRWRRRRHRHRQHAPAGPARRGHGQRLPHARAGLRRHAPGQHRASHGGLPAGGARSRRSGRRTLGRTHRGLRGRHGNLHPARAVGQRRLPPCGLPCDGPAVPLQRRRRGGQAARARCEAVDRCAGHRRQHGLGRAGVPGRRRLDQAHAPRLGRAGRHHGGIHGAPWLCLTAATVRRPLRFLRDAHAGTCGRGRPRLDRRRAGQPLDHSGHSHQALPRVPFHPWMR